MAFLTALIQSSLSPLLTAFRRYDLVRGGRGREGGRRGCGEGNRTEGQRERGRRKMGWRDGRERERGRGEREKIANSIL